MWLRFQTGSNMPLAKRSASRFWTASRPRKWSIRKTRSSAKTACTSALSSRALVEVGAERLLEDHPRALGQPGRRRAPRPWRRTRRAGSTGSAGGAARRRAPSRPRRPPRAAASGSSALNALNASGAANRSHALAGRAPSPIGARGRARGSPRPIPPLAGGADDPVALRHQPRAVEVEEARQQLAPGEVAERAEEDDHVVLGDRGAV